jgi:hypothetical protein
VWYVAVSGDDSADCLSPVTACATVNGALAKPGFASGDQVRVAIGTYTGTGAEVVRVTTDASLSGGWNSSFSAQSGASTIDGQGARRGITVVGGTTVVVDRFTIENGFDTGGGGGGISSSSNSSDLTVTNSTITNNRSLYPAGGAIGGGIFTYGALTVTDSSITMNTGSFGGGGIFHAGSAPAAITDSPIDGNTAGASGYSGGGGGGGVWQDSSGLMTITGSTLSNNRIVGFFSGSGLEAIGPVVLKNSTVSGNTGASSGGGIYVFVYPVDIEDTTVANNELYGILNVAGKITLMNSLIAGNSGTSDCFNDLDGYNGTVTSDGYNLVENPGNCTLGNTDLTNVDPQLGSLRDNGGPTFTQAPFAHSPAVDAIPVGANGCGTTLTVDQRGVSRPQGAACDIGAVEVIPGQTAQITIEKTLVPSADAGRFDLKVDSTVVKAAAGNGDSGATEVPAGTYTVSEQASTGSLSDYVSSISCLLNGNPGPSGPGTSLDVTVSADDQLTCTITNQRKATITLGKTIVPANDTGRFDLLVDSTVVKAAAGNGDSGATEVPAGTYTVSEQASTGSLSDYVSSISCLLNGNPGPSGPGTSLDVTVSAGDQLTCTITNQRKPKITVTNHLVPSYDPGRFNLQIDSLTYAANVRNNGTTGAITVPVGSHIVGETAGTNTILDQNHYVTQIACSDGSNGHQTNLPVTVTWGDKLTCTITNTRKLHHA